MAREGQQLGRYHLIRLLGSGGMGEVYLAADASVQRQVAIKVIRTEVMPDYHTTSAQEALRLFQREARAVAALDHPNILPLYDYGEMATNDATIAYLVMPYRPEGSLVAWLRQRQSATPELQANDIIFLLRQVAEALQYAHTHGIVHQDVKPANFLIRENQLFPNRPTLFLTDFGIARFITTTAQSSHNVRGTLAYMAPEQLEGYAVPASDQYALAIMAYELLTGRLPFQGSLAQVMHHHLTVQPPPPSTFNPSLSPTIDAVFFRALAKKPDERYASVIAFPDALEKAMQGGATPIITRNATNVTTQASAIEATLVINDEEARRGTTRNLILPSGRQVTVVISAGAYQGQVIQVEDREPLSERHTTVVIKLAITPTTPVYPFAMVEPTISAPPPRETHAVRTDNERNPSRPVSTGMFTTSTRKHTGIMPVFLIVLALLVLMSGIGLAFFYVATTRQAAIHTNTPSSRHSTPQASTTGTTVSTTTNPYTHTGVLVLNDPLQDNSKGVDWMTGMNQNQATCAFTGGAYQSSQPIDGDFHACLALNTDYSNFVFQVQMTIVSGDAGGIIFRANQAKSTFYYFRVGQDGSYDLRVYVDPLIDHSRLLTSGMSSALHTGYDQANTLAVVARGNQLQFYANGQLMTTANDMTFSQGQIGVVAYNQGGLATVVYSNAEVWNL